jgi:hypothetical protein
VARHDFASPLEDGILSSEILHYMPLLPDRHLLFHSGVLMIAADA